MVRLQVGLAAELGSDRSPIDVELSSAADERAVLAQVASTFNIAERDKIIDRLCFRLPDLKRPLSFQELSSDTLFNNGPRAVVLGIDSAKDFILNLIDPANQKKSLFMIKKELAVRLSLSLLSVSPSPQRGLFVGRVSGLRRDAMQDGEFVFEFIRQGGVRVIANLMMNLSGSLLAYCLSSLELVMSHYVGWEGIEPEHIEKVLLFLFLSESSSSSSLWLLL